MEAEDPDRIARHHPTRRWRRTVRALLIIVIAALGLPIAYRWLEVQRESSGRMPCPSNLRQVGQAIQIYANDHGGAFPATLEPLFDGKYLMPKTFICPSSGDTAAGGETPEQVRAQLMAGDHVSYIYIGAGLTYNHGADYVVAYDRPRNHAPDGANILYADGHVDWMAMRAFQHVLDEVAAGRLPVRISASGSTSATAPTTKTSSGR
jgi:prepilin-type processing-associated H-X9-DG protein